ncbi:MAG TPA: hypothetical protein VLZ81_02285 [Blastocatellia bacterium]|nr:hypothetical protein [Blastocatellia bacterium]
MADNDYSSISRFNSAAQKEAWPLIGFIILDAVASLIILWIVGTIANSL